MKRAHQIAVSVFVQDGEDEAAIVAALRQLFPFGLAEEKIALERKTAAGFHDLPIVIYGALLTKEKHTSAFLDALIGRLDREQRQLIADEALLRVDDACSFFLRLDKAALLQGKYGITNGGSCFHIKMSIAAFPKKKERAVEVVKGMLAPVDL